MVAIADVYEEVKYLIQDDSDTRVSESGFLAALNMTLSRMVMLRPDLFSHIGVMPTVSGVVQSLPAGAVRLVEVYGKRTGSGLRVEYATMEVSREVLDQTAPLWTADTVTGTPTMFVRNIRNPTSFFVYPPVPAETALVVEYIKSPTRYTSVSDTIAELPVGYTSVVVDGVVAYLESMDAEHAVADRAALHEALFIQALSEAALAREILDTENAGIGPIPGYVRPERKVV